MIAIFVKEVTGTDVEKEQKTVTITNVSNATITVTDKDSKPVTSGQKVDVGSVLNVSVTPASDSYTATLTVDGKNYTQSTLTVTDDVTISAKVTEKGTAAIDDNITVVLIDKDTKEELDWTVTDAHVVTATDDKDGDDPVNDG